MFGLNKKWIALVALVPVGGIAAYLLGVHFWANHHYRCAQEALDRRDFQQASVHLRKYLDARPGDSEARLLAARTARRQGDFREAADLLHVCEQKGSNLAGLELEHRLLRAQEGDRAEASSLLAAVAARPDAPEAPLVLEAVIEANLRVLMPAYLQGLTFPGNPAADEVENTRRAVERWLTLRPGSADQVQGLVWRAQTHVFAHADPLALQDLRKALEMDAEHFDARLHLAMLLSQQAPGEASIHLKVLRGRQPDNYRVNIALATLKRRLGKLDESQEILDELLAVNPDDVSTLLERGRVAMDVEDRAAAERWLRRAYQLAPRAPEVVLALSRCLRQAGKIEEAERLQREYEQIESQKKAHQAKQKGTHGK
jgi:tetratricopeptide (TPR) repeat protein